MSSPAPSPVNALAALKQFTVVVADSGDFQAIRVHQPQDATTNPSLIIRALEQPQYAEMLQQVKRACADRSMADRAREVLVAFGREILEVIPGRVSTEVDARLSPRPRRLFRPTAPMAATPLVFLLRSRRPGRGFVRFVSWSDRGSPVMSL